MGDAGGDGVPARVPEVDLTVLVPVLNEAENMRPLVAKIDEGFDLVSGWKQNRRDPITKTVPSRLFNAVTSAVSGVPLHDMNCGLKAYRMEVTRTIQLRGELHRFIPVLAHWSGFRVG